ncbi:MAG: hypothetical protein K9M75_08940 [Phycisphaerae bacterium]|nr:hypothetical protein [Phycisphaerae bacterium]
MNLTDFKKGNITTAKKIGFKYTAIGCASFAVIVLLLGAIKAYHSTTGIAVAMGTMSGMVILASKEAYRAGMEDKDKS